MKQPHPLTRRTWLARHAAGLLLGSAGARLALAAAPTVTPGSDPATAPRLVVVMLRGALDGLAAVPPVGDPQWATLRPTAEADAARHGAPLPLDATFALHPQLAGLHRWWGEGSLLVAHAVAQPYRERSHFDAQQMLESGGRAPFELDTGWLGRALAQAGQPGLALSPQVPVALRGSEQAGNWSPSREREAGPDLMERVQRLYSADAQLSGAWAQALVQMGMVGTAAPAARPAAAPSPASAASASMGMAGDAPVARPGSNAAGVALARQAGRFLSDPAGPRLAWLELGGWDTHTAQAARLNAPLGELDASLVALREALGAHWAHTTVLVMTEFGRTAAINGSGGTDHGTASIALLAGGRVRGGQVRTDWPGLAPAQLHEQRDLRPTADLRGLQRAVLEATWPLTRAAIERTVLPGAPPAWPGLFRDAA